MCSSDLVGQVESKVAAYAFILVGLQAWLDERPVVAGACLGLATSLHVLVGGQASLALTLAWLVERPWRSPRPALRAASAWLVGALPALVLVWSASHTVVQSDPPMSWIYVVFRVPHHADPNSWAWTWRLLLLFSKMARHEQHHLARLADCKFDKERHGHLFSNALHPLLPLRQIGVASRPCLFAVFTPL